MASASVSEKAAEARYSISPEIHEIIHPPKPSKPSTMSSSSSYTSSEAKVIVKPKRRSARAGSAHKAKGRARHKKNNMAERKRPPEQNDATISDAITRAYQKYNKRNKTNKTPETDSIYVKLKDPKHGHVQAICIPGFKDVDVHFTCNVCRRTYRYKSYGSHKEKCERKAMELIEEGEKVPGVSPDFYEDDSGEDEERDSEEVS